MLNINVAGGTNAGRRVVRTLKRVDWTCGSCDARNRYYWKRCPVCGANREED